MTADEMPACTKCGGQYPSALAASLCCDPEYDQPRFSRSYELGNN